MQKKYGVINQLRKTRMLELFRTYLVVGGIPRAVERYKETNNFSIIQDIQRTIMKDYELDIIKYAESNEKQKVRSCFLSIPKQLAKENRKFQYSMVEKGSSARKYSSVFFGSQMQMWQISVITSQHWNYHSRLTKKRMISKSIYLIPGFSSLNTRREPHWISSRIKLDGTKVQYMRMLSHRCLQQKAIAFISSSHHRIWKSIL